ncbi:60S ribosomal protein L14 [Lutzomyia longipalpis]|uniref:Large ribosomal subunit protein eL14 n=1 Tax=Lutzomyia longipalpis TaxID=7200 RepID=A0A7G3ABI0_LUTLO|nr:60S ribosomal protein L14 [Lutzomyia longipalpis]
MPFKRFVETGRVAKCSHGPLKGKLVAIVDVIDPNRVLIDGPCTGVKRQAYRLNNLHLTKFVLKFPFTSPTRVIRKAWLAADVNAKWAETCWAKKAKAQEKRSNLNDYDRFKLRVAKRSRNRMLTVQFRKMKRYASIDGTLFGEKSIRKPKLWKDQLAKRKAKKPSGGKTAAAAE